MRMNLRRNVSLALCLALCLSLFALPGNAAAASSKTILAAQARRLALANSPDITEKSNEIILKKMDYVEAVDEIQAKMTDKKTFRWTPLLSFKFPQSLNMSDEYDLNIKPLNLQAEIETLQHALNDLTWQTYAETDKLYADIYVEQEKISFTKSRLETAKTELAQNKARLIGGGATQSDVEKMQANVDKLTAELAELERSFLANKKKLSDKIGVDVSSGYVFRNGMQSLNLPREQLDTIVQYTIDNDQSFYETKATFAAAKLNLNAYERFMQGHFGSKMDYINNYIQAAKNGQKIDNAAFKISYKAMLKASDKPWTGSWKIIFWKFPKNWFEGDIDGTRYIEDDLYAVYSACTEYANAKTTMDNAEKQLRANVTSSYEALVTGYNAYTSAVKLSDTMKKTYDKVSALNKLGKADYAELKDARDAYEEQQVDTVTALADYNTLLYEFDRLTCGAASKYFSGASISGDSGAAGDSFSTIDPISQPYYYIYSSVANLTFYIGVSVPKDFEPAIDSFEVWKDGVQIGTRTKTGKELRHLVLDYSDSSELTIRLYDGDTFVNECKIDASVPRAVLPLTTDTGTNTQELKLGTYSVSSTSIGSITTSKLTLKLIGKGLEAKKYSLEYGENGAIRSSELTKVGDDFTYLSILVKSLDGVTLKLCDESGNVLYKARFDTSTQTIYGTAAKS